MFEIGQKVEIVGPGDETFDEKFIGMIGVISVINTGGGRFDTGQSVDDPFYAVEFGNGLHELFWNEEMKKLD